MSPACDFDRTIPNVAIWHEGAALFDVSFCFGRCICCRSNSLYSESFDGLIDSAHVAGITVTNFSRQEASAQFAEQFSAPIFAGPEAFPNKAPRKFGSVADGEETGDRLHVISIEGARKLLVYRAERILFAHGMPILSGAGKQLRRLLDSNL